MSTANTTPLDKEGARLALTRVTDPRTGRDIVASGGVEKIAACDGHVSVRIAGAGLHDDRRAGLRQQIGAALRLHAQQASLTLSEAHVEFTDAQPTPGAHAGASQQQAERPGQGRPQESAEALPGIKRAIAVGAGKGGVGKSTVAVNLAVGLARLGRSVGLMDGDIYGPSLPTMMGLHAAEMNVRGNMIQPFVVEGVKCVTIGKMVEPEKPLIWRGPMAHGAFKQLLEQTEWGELDELIIDLPPGTGDISLTMAQTLRLTGAVVVCTPQRVAQDDAVRAARMFQQLGVDVLGVVENMSYFVGDDGKEYDIFGRGGAEQMAQRLGLPYLGAVPITMGLRERGDSGDPGGNFTEGGPLTEALEAVVRNLQSQVALAEMRAGSRPTLSIS